MRFQALLLTLAFSVGLAVQNSAAQNPPELTTVDAIINRSVEARQIPGAVLIVGHNGQQVIRKAYGSRALVPLREAMTVDTVFDIASLTKCVVTGTALAQLIERGEVRLNDPVSKYLPEFGRNGKQDITVRQLATHYSGLREDFNSSQTGKRAAYRMADDEEPISVPGSDFRYSDINYIVLGELIEKVSGLSLDQYAEKNIFTPLGMLQTRYLPPPTWKSKTAPTEFTRGHKVLRGVAHDPFAQDMGGVAGHAGVFSTADDLAKFAQAILDGRFVVSAPMLEKMTQPQQPPTATVLRGIGWDLDSPFSSNRGALLPIGSFGHTGFTGTSLWIDPTTKTYIVLLTNAVHPRARPNSPAVPLRDKVASAVAAALKLSPSEEEVRRTISVTGYNEALSGSRRLTSRNGEVQTGIDVLVAENFRALKQLSRTGTPVRLGVVTNQTGLDSQGRRTIDLLAHADGLSLQAIFSPEHGVTGTLDTTSIGDNVDAVTGTKVYSVYGATDAQKRPSLEVLRTLDAVVFDLQDVGARWYTYETTLGYFLEACAKAGIPLVVLDRPNPITGSFIQGPVSDEGKSSFVNYMPVPIRHGMTMGELAGMFNGEHNLAAKLTVVKMQGWQRGDWFDSTALPWTPPSPNLRRPTQAILYPGVAMVEGTNISVGRGTDSPFELLGAPWINSRQLATYLNARRLSGIRFVPMDFTPTANPFANQLCHGVNFIITDRNQFDSPELGVELASTLLKLYPEQYRIDRIGELIVNQATLDGLRSGDDPRRIAGEWRDRRERWERIRGKYLLY
jgi:uncharacterized protein YbbC (DUF1343 family)/CubicO group peptidase (beta-lactamase class C family)